MGWLESKMAASGGAGRQPDELQSEYTQRKIDAYNERIRERKADDKGYRNLEEERDDLYREKSLYEYDEAKTEAERQQKLEEAKKAGVVIATPDTPKVEHTTEEYRGYDIVSSYDPSTGKTQHGVSIEGKYDRFDTPEEAQARVDRYHYEHSETYLNEKAAEKKAQQEAYSERAMIYGIGTDMNGNPIYPTEEEIAAREEYYAKERLIRGTTIREEYEIEKGIIPTEEEQKIRDEALIKEAEAQGLPGNLYFLMLLGELRQIRTEIVNIVRSFTG